MDIKLSDSEQKILDSMRKRQAQWPTTRWIFIALGIFNLLSGVSSYLRHHDEAFGLLAGTVGFALMVQTMSKWNGSPSRILLLKIFESRS